MKLVRITKIRGHRMFRDFAWASDLHSFGRFNLIYGWNGCGKTTLSSLFAQIEKRSAVTEGDVEFEFDGSSKVPGSALGTAQLPQVRVFNRDFINATFQSAGSGMAPIYFLGKDSVEKQAKVAELKKQLAEAESQVAAASKEKTVTAAKLDEFCVSKAKLIKELLTTGNSTAYNNYDKRRFKQTIDGATAADVLPWLLSDDLKKRLLSQKDAQPKGTVGKVAAPSVDLAALELEADELTRRVVIAETLDELVADADLGAWVQRGVALHSGGRHSDTCKFCEHSLTAARRAALEAHFNKGFAELDVAITALLTKLEATKQSLLDMALPEPTRFYDHLVADATNAVAVARAWLSTTACAVDAMIARVSEKRDHPFAPTTGSPSSSSTVDVVARRNAIAAIDAVIDVHNRTTDDFKASVDEACKRLERSYVADAHAEYVLLNDRAKLAAEVFSAASAGPQKVQAEIDVLEKEIIEHRRPADELTEELRAYLGRDELRFEVKETGYSLTRGGQPVTHLSEGERTAIAFLYFLKSLQDKSFDLGNGIVVIDDPVSSLDANALFSAFGFMKERTKECGQLIIFTHSFPFFRLAKNWLHHLPGQRKKDAYERPAKFFMLSAHHGPSRSRTSQLGPLDPLLEHYESEYQYLFKRVYDEAHRSNVESLEHHYGLPNIARRLIEAFLAFRFPDQTGDLRLRFERVAFDNAKKTRVLRLLHTYSHADAVIDPEHDLSLLAETQPVLRDLLDMMEATDPGHFAGLTKLVTVAVP